MPEVKEYVGYTRFANSGTHARSKKQKLLEYLAIQELSVLPI